MIRIDVETRTWVTDRADPDDSWSRDSYAGTVVGVSGHYITDANQVGQWRSTVFDLDARPGDVVHAVVVDYESGDTFGRSGGQSEVLDVFPRDKWEEAFALKLAAEKVGRGQFGLEYRGRQYYAGWTGYFERLQEIRVHSIVVQG